MPVDVIVTASHGCRHAATVLSVIRQQCKAGDRLLVLESEPCDFTPGVAGAEDHVTGSVDDFESRVEGLRRSTGDTVLILEDHGVPEPEFLEALRTYFGEHKDQTAVTFWMRNGSLDGAASRALFAFVAGAAVSTRTAGRPAIVASSFALTGQELEDCRQAARDGVLAPGNLEYQVIPRLLSGAKSSVPTELTLIHHQRNTVREALSATYWNARQTGWVERDARLSGGAVRHTVKRYPGRAVRLLRRGRGDLPERCILVAMGSVGLAGWWAGRLHGPGRSATRLRDAHPVPA